MQNFEHSFSVLDRKQHLESLKKETFDLLVIGGGATGCGIALDAASRGLKTALIEKGDFASGTSSKSTKLIHGGLRYLKQLDIGLVRETGTERAIVHRLAPHLVLPEKMLMPLIKGGNYGKWATSFGLWVYDILAGVEGEDRRKMLSKKQTLKLEPLLEEQGLKGGGYYAEYRTDDARLAIALIKTAVTHGALALNYCKATGFQYQDKLVNAVACTDELSGQKFLIKAEKIVSAGGPWVDRLRTKDGSKKGKRLHLTKGVHIVFPHEKFPLKQTTYFDAPDGRMIFAIPRAGITYVGTTDTNYTGNLNRVVTTKADTTYLLNVIQYAFPSIKLAEKDIVSNWAGLRPLIHEEGKSPSELSRKDEIFISDSGLISIAGGKLTGYRKMAQRIVDLVVEQIPKSKTHRYTKCQTKKIPLSSNPFKNSKEVHQFITDLQIKIDQFGLQQHHAKYLTHTYGKDALTILAKMPDFDTDSAEINLARAELWFGVHQEMISRAADYFVRRTGRLYFEIESIYLIRSKVMEDLKNYLNWDDNRWQSENEMLDELVYDATHFYDQELSP